MSKVDNTMTAGEPSQQFQVQNEMHVMSPKESAQWRQWFANQQAAQWQERFASQQSPEPADTLVNWMPSPVTGQTGAEAALDMATCTNLRAKLEANGGVKPGLGMRQAEACWRQSPAETEGQALAAIFQVRRLNGVEKEIEAEWGRLMNLHIAPGDELAEKERKVKLQALDEMKIAIADYKKSSDAGPYTKDAEFNRMDTLSAKFQEARQKALDQLETIRATRSNPDTQPGMSTAEQDAFVAAGIAAYKAQQKQNPQKQS